MFWRSEERRLIERTAKGLEDHIAECSRRYEASEKTLDRLTQAVEFAARAPGELEKRLMRWLLSIVGMIALKVLADVIVPHVLVR